MRLFLPPNCAGCNVLLAESHALCPVCWKRLHFISRPFCEKYAVPFSYEKAADALSPEAYRFPPPWSQARAVALFEELAADLVHGLKYKDRHDYAPLMARLMSRAAPELIEQADLVCPVPLHWGRFIRRRCNQSALLAKAVAKQNGKNFLAGALKRHKSTRSQVGLSREARARNLAGVFSVKTARVPVLRDRSVLLIDDVMTSGATLGAATKALLKAGAREVNVLVFARVTNIIE